jgi:hypothetical protein
LRVEGALRYPRRFADVPSPLDFCLPFSSASHLIP